MTDKIYTTDEIYAMFDNSDLNKEFKSIIKWRFDALCQAMVNVVQEPEKTMTMSDTYGDEWVEEHNRFVTEYQKFYS